MTHEIFHADPKNRTRILVKLKERESMNKVNASRVRDRITLPRDFFATLEIERRSFDFDIDFDSLAYSRWVRRNLGHRPSVRDFFAFCVVRRRLYLMRMNRASAFSN